MKIFLSLIGIVGSFLLIRFRSAIGDMIGDADWMRYVGGPFNLVVIVAIFIFFWSIAALTGTEEFLLSPVLWLFPVGNRGPAVDTF